MNKTEKCKER